MSDRNNVYFGALLHDIGKFVERGKLEEIQRAAKSYVDRGDASETYAHKRYSAWFIDEFRSYMPFLTNAVSSFALWHHRGNDPTKGDFESIDKKGVPLKLIRIADDCASAERIEDAELMPEKYHLARLQSPFRDVNIDVSVDGKISQLKPEKTRYLDFSSLSTERNAAFPDHLESAVQDEKLVPYRPLVQEFLEACRSKPTEEGLLYLMEKYLSNVPAQTPVEFNGKERLSKPDINLYDHSRVTAALAVCLYDEYLHGSWKGKDSAILSKDGYHDLPAPVTLVCGDVSGIQDFIFNIPSRLLDERGEKISTAKSLKGRSFYVQTLSDVVARFLLDGLDLKPVNLLYNGGGNFYLVIPSCKVEKLRSLIPDISRALLQDNLFIAFGFTPLSITDFIKKDGGNKITDRWKEVGESVNIAKRQRFKELSAKEIFDPLPQQDGQPVRRVDELSRNLYNAKGLSIQPLPAGTTERAGWQKTIHDLGYELIISPSDKLSPSSILLNDTRFCGPGCISRNTLAGFRFLVKDVPVWRHTPADDNGPSSMEYWKSIMEKLETDDLKSEEKPIPEQAITFHHMARFAESRTGTPKIGILKMDIDNLGSLFETGLPEELKSISRIASLSRNLRWFFEGYINTIIQEPDYRYDIYTVFSGGDDFFAVGAWDRLFSFATRIRSDFKEFTGNHPGITLSAGLLLVDDKFPVKRFAHLADEALDEAKSRQDAAGNLVKNAISVFGYTLSWDEFDEARQLKDDILNLVKQKKARSVIGKLLLFSRELEPLRRGNRKSHIPLPRLWRLAYSFRETAGKDTDSPGKKQTDQLIEKINQIVFKRLKGQDTEPMLVAVAARWAEFESRLIKNQPKEQE
ncbi:MAG: type III-A CRISPR-associated protein Cas10/Csm1 [Bacteroidetes bacterium]|nr:type III-A CRISPR-associated protein Cas10/Csm1 [Bacteroidota bacterium]